MVIRDEASRKCGRQWYQPEAPPPSAACLAEAAGSTMLVMRFVTTTLPGSKSAGITYSMSVPDTRGSSPFTMT